MEGDATGGSGGLRRVVQDAIGLRLQDHGAEARADHIVHQQRRQRGGLAGAGGAGNQYVMSRAGVAATDHRQLAPIGATDRQPAGQSSLSPPAALSAAAAESIKQAAVLRHGGRSVAAGAMVLETNVDSPSQHAPRGAEDDGKSDRQGRRA